MLGITVVILSKNFSKMLNRVQHDRELSTVTKYDV